MSTVIKVENISKLYQLGTVGTGTLSHDLNRWWAKVRGKEDPAMLITDSMEVGSAYRYNWALKDVSFEVEQGKAIGIIGKNGAGKSTILKILSKVTAPTSGQIKTKGRIASLLEVGTGFHPELSGLENIYLNGAILGMTKSEIRNKLDEIIDFSGIEKYIETPVKRYSSGMYVRLAFAVAAHLEPEILIIDEVLAVGDAEFQKKCIGKMGDVAKGGRTILFVSHNMAAISELCSQSILLKKGMIAYYGESQNAIKKYLGENLKNISSKDLSSVRNRDGNGTIKFISYSIFDEQGNELDYIFSGQNVTFALNIERFTDILIPSVHFSLMFIDESEKPFFHISNSVANGEEFKINLTSRIATVFCNIPKFPMHTGEYYFGVYCGVFGEVYDHIVLAGSLKVEAGNFYSSGKLPYRELGDFLVENKWSMKEQN